MTREGVKNSPFSSLSLSLMQAPLSPDRRAFYCRGAHWERPPLPSDAHISSSCPPALAAADRRTDLFSTTGRKRGKEERGRK